MVPKTYTTRPAGPVIPASATANKPTPEGHWLGEEKYHVWLSRKIAPHHRERGVFREYEVFGLLGWLTGPRAAQLNLSRNWTLRLLKDGDGAVTAEAEVILYRRSAKIVGGSEPERGIVVTMPLSEAHEDAEVRRLKRYVLRLASWSGNRLGERFDAYLADQGL